MLLSPPVIIANLFAVTVYFAAMTWGGRTERLGGSILLVCQFISIVVTSRSDWASPQLIILIIDTLLLIPAFGLTLRSDSAWTAGWAAYQALTVITHAAILLEPAGGHPATRAWAYVTGLVVWGYLIWIFLAWGTWSAWKQRSRNVVGDAASGRNPQR